jgi:type IV pilus assembly protein PilB
MQKVGDRKAFIQALTFATGQRLARRLCDSCKQPLQANPKLLQQLGATAGDEVNLCGPYKLPPVEQRVDEHGQPIEMQECQLCGGLGYIGRIAIIESIVIDEEIRKVLTQSPRLDILAKAVQQRGNKTQLQQGYRLALAGLTSVQEIQRVFQPKKK